MMIPKWFWAFIFSGFLLTGLISCSNSQEASQVAKEKKNVESYEMLLSGHDTEDIISEKVSFVDYHYKKLHAEKYRFYFLFKVNSGFEKNWRIYFHGHVKGEDVNLLPKKRQKYKFDNWDFSPNPPTSVWSKDEYIIITREISAKPILYNVILGFYRPEEGRHGKQIKLGWLNLDDKKMPERRGSFTGPDISSFAPLLGDYANVGVRTGELRTDIPRLMTALENLHAQDYMHSVWSTYSYPSEWEDFQLMAPEFQKAGRRLWLYLPPPSEPPQPGPFGYDYVRWAVECAKLAKQYPVVAGICIDDFNGNVSLFTPTYCKQMMDAARKIAPHLKLLVVSYYGWHKYIAPHVETRAIDGVVFPYFFPHKNHSDTTKLLSQIESYRGWLDQLSDDMPLVVMIYAMRHSQSPDIPTPAYVKECLDIALKATEEGLADGAVTYGLPKDKPLFVEAVATVYKQQKLLKKRDN